MIRAGHSIILLIGLALAACSPGSLFPAGTTDGVDSAFDFTAWRNMPNAQTGRKVQLGGRIVQALPEKGGVTFIVTQLQVVDYPAYGPQDTGKRSGEFAVVYADKLDPKWLTPGHRLMVIGTTAPAKAVLVDDVRRNLPSVTASCLHIWRTAGKEIAEFPYNIGGGYEPLEEDTHCVP